jgi:hypothetical protein
MMDESEEVGEEDFTWEPQSPSAKDEYDSPRTVENVSEHLDLSSEDGSDVRKGMDEQQDLPVQCVSDDEEIEQTYDECDAWQEQEQEQEQKQEQQEREEWEEWEEWGEQQREEKGGEGRWDGGYPGISLEDYFPANFVNEAYPAEERLGDFLEDDALEGSAATGIAAHLLDVEDDASPDKKAAGMIILPYTPQQPRRATQQQRSLRVPRQSAVQASAVDKHKQWLVDLEKKRKMESDELELQQKQRDTQRQRRRETILKRAMNKRAPPDGTPLFLIQTEAALKAQVERKEQGEGAVDLEERTQQIAAVRRKFKEQHKKLLASLIDKKKHAHAAEQLEKELAHVKKAKVKRIAQLQRRRALDEAPQASSLDNGACNEATAVCPAGAAAKAARSHSASDSQRWTDERISSHSAPGHEARKSNPRDLADSTILSDSSDGEV